MTWPTTLTTTYTGNASASVSDARSEINAGILAVNDIIGSRGTAGGVAALTGTGVIQANNMPATYSTSSQDITLQPGSDRVAVQNILNLEPQTVTQITAIATPVEGDVMYCTNGDAGDKCIAVYDGSNWKAVSLGSTISSS